MPIKAMKARYYSNAGKKEDAYSLARKAIKDNPNIGFPDNLLAKFFISDKQFDSAYHYAKQAYEKIPNNLPHYDVYMRTLVRKKMIAEIHQTFEEVSKKKDKNDTKWAIYIRSIAQTTPFGDSLAISKAKEAYEKHPNNNSIFSIYRMLNYGQPRVVEADKLFKRGVELYESKKFEEAAKLFSEAHEKDPLELKYALHSGIAFNALSQHDVALQYAQMAKHSIREGIQERVMRQIALNLYRLGKKQAACSVFNQLFRQYPKRMYKQEYEKYCTNNP